MVFLDTEFHQSARGLWLLSVGMVGPTSEFYAELDAPGLFLIPGLAKNDFVQGEVLSQFGLISGAQVSQLEMSNRAVRWLNDQGADDVLEIVYDFSADFSLLENLLNLACVKVNARLEAVHVGYLLEDPDGTAAAQAAWFSMMGRAGVGRHHALGDAVALRARFEAVHMRP